MKYLMGLIIAMAVGTSAFAQNRPAINSSANTSGSKCFRPIKGEASMSGNNAGMMSEEVAPGVNMTCGFAFGSVEYSRNYSGSGRMAPGRSMQNNNNKSRSRNMSSMNSVEESASPANTTSGVNNQASLRPNTAKLLSECALKEELNSKSGRFKENRKLDNGKLRMEREKDGKEEVDYKSNSEYYRYEKNEKGKESSVHALYGDKEAIEIRKNDNGTADIVYEGHFNSVEEAQNALNQGLLFESYDSACNTAE